MPSPLEEQLEKLARRWEKEADEGELLDEVAYALEGAADELRALLPLEVTDGEARTEPYRCAECDQTHGPFSNVRSGRSDKPEVAYRLVCDRCWGPKPAAPVEVTDESVTVTLSRATIERAQQSTLHAEDMREANAILHDMAEARDEIDDILSAALTQKGDNE